MQCQWLELAERDYESWGFCISAWVFNNWFQHRRITQKQSMQNSICTSKIGDEQFGELLQKSQIMKTSLLHGNDIPLILYNWLKSPYLPDFATWIDIQKPFEEAKASKKWFETGSSTNPVGKLLKRLTHNPCDLFTQIIFITFWSQQH